MKIAMIAWMAALWVLPAQAAEWQKTGTSEDGITVYKMEIPGNPVLAFRGEGDVEGPIDRIASVIFDTHRAPEWVADLEESRVVKWLSADEYIEYDHVNTPPVIMKDRDFVSIVKIQVNPLTHETVFKYRLAPEDAVPLVSKYVRGNLLDTTFTMTPLPGGLKAHVDGQILCDPKGSIPKWLVNWFQSDWPNDTIRSLRKQVAKKDIQLDPKILQLFGQK